MLKRRTMQAAVALVLGALGIGFTAQPAQAAVVIPAGTAGHACGGYKTVNAFIDFQVCAWASTGSQPRVWFTAHYRNNGPLKQWVNKTSLGYAQNGQYLQCNPQGEIYVPPNGVQASNDSCQLPRYPSSYQAWIYAYATDRSEPVENLSPTIVVR
jgi:hypothetical protein